MLGTAPKAVFSTSSPACIMPSSFSWSHTPSVFIYRYVACAKNLEFPKVWGELSGRTCTREVICLKKIFCRGVQHCCTHSFSLLAPPPSLDFISTSVYTTRLHFDFSSLAPFITTVSYLSLSRFATLILLMHDTLHCLPQPFLSLSTVFIPSCWLTTSEEPLSQLHFHPPAFPSLLQLGAVCVHLPRTPNQQQGQGQSSQGTRP